MVTPHLHLRLAPWPLILVLGTKVYGFLTVSEDAKCGVCAHEIGHLGE